MTDRRAARELAGLGVDERLLARLCEQAAEPEQVPARLLRLVQAAHSLGIALQAGELQVVAPLLGLDAPAARLAARPRLVRWLARTPFLERERTASSFAAQVRCRAAALDPGDTEALWRVLRLYRHREMARIALRDLTRRAPLATVTRELSALADALVDAALRFVDAALAPAYGAPLGDSFCVVAMGKHGARELNYSSDIDVLFVFDADGAGPAGRPRREQATRVAEGVIHALSRVTAHGFAFRVDPNLRPEGRAGPLANPVALMERYYERAGATWERAALIKARPCAGGLAVGEELVGRLRPFVWRRSLDLAAVEAIAAMKRRIDSDARADDVKLGRGGIREIEFFVQALQLLHGGRQPSLRVRDTPGALDALVYAGLLPAADRDALADAYVFLRDVEHRLQLPGDRQTQQLPADEAARRRLARLAGVEPRELERLLARHRDAVHGRFASLLAAAADQVALRPEVAVALSSERADAEREAALRALGFEPPEDARNELERLARHVEGAFGARGRERHPGLAERLLGEMARSPEPAQALARFASVTTPLWAPAVINSLFAANFATARLLILLFGSSETLGRDFQMHPELLDALVRRDGAALEKDRARLQEETAPRLARAGSPEEKLAALRLVRREETLRVGLHDLAGRLDQGAAGRQLTLVAEVLLAEALALARADVAARWGEPEQGALAVLGLGSFGAAELDYQSDLDLVFVHDAQGRTSGGDRGSLEAPEWAARVAQRLLSNLTMTLVEGVLYRVDARLRPSGSHGPLVASLRALAEYHSIGEPAGARQAALWERQALLKARPVAGDAELGARAMREVLDVAVYERPLPADAAAQVSSMRRRLDVAPTAEGIDPKRAPGGLLDVDFAVQYLQLVHRVRATATGEALERLRDAGAVAPATAAELLASRALLRRLESRLRLSFDRAEVFVPTRGRGLQRLARQMGESGTGAGERLLRGLRRTLDRTRALFDGIVR